MGDQLTGTGRQTSTSRPREDSWRARPVLSLLMRLAIYGVPLLAGVAVSVLSSALLPADWNPWLLFLLRGAAAVAASMVVAGATTRLMPLALLLRMTMLFPAEAPSRLAVARRTTSVKELTRRLEHGEPTEREAATTMLALVTALDRHDRKTRGHSERVRLFCDLLGEELGLDAGDRGRLRWAALVHDIGKLQVNERILNKPASLSDTEWSAIKAHPDAGARLAQPLASWLGPWFRGIAEHHERYDGTGYPRGLSAEQISLAGRAIAVVDSFETMTAARAYKSPMSTWSARAELTRCAGTHFDPVVVRAFLQIALPRVLRAVGPLAFLINAPLLRVLGQAPVRAVDAATVASSQALSAAGVTAVAVAVSTAPAHGSGAAISVDTVNDLGWSPRTGAGHKDHAPSAERSAGHDRVERTEVRGTSHHKNAALGKGPSAHQLKASRATSTVAVPPVAAPVAVAAPAAAPAGPASETAAAVGVARVPIWRRAGHHGSAGTDKHADDNSSNRHGSSDHGSDKPADGHGSSGHGSDKHVDGHGSSGHGSDKHADDHSRGRSDTHGTQPSTGQSAPTSPPDHGPRSGKPADVPGPKGDRQPGGRRSSGPPSTEQAPSSSRASSSRTRHTPPTKPTHDRRTRPAPASSQLPSPAPAPAPNVPAPAGSTHSWPGSGPGSASNGGDAGKEHSTPPASNQHGGHR